MTSSSHMVGVLVFKQTHYLRSTAVVDATHVLSWMKYLKISISVCCRPTLHTYNGHVQHSCACNQEKH